MKMKLADEDKLKNQKQNQGRENIIHQTQIEQDKSREYKATRKWKYKKKAYIDSFYNLRDLHIQKQMAQIRTDRYNFTKTT